ncbi:MAG TPA: zf-TFIIB domain-containing protein [Sandaracinaceae bacterium LLY-WYZ-13_1]|nr:zf-TFIIB domain-containing protein [Sandaracinaceae bacterium LLY-WYZ-13_1]
MDCPRCRRPLTRIDEGLHEDIETHACSSCGGTFYPPGSLDRLDDQVTVDVESLERRPRPGAPALRCPLGHASLGGTYRRRGEHTLKPCAPLADPRVAMATCDRCGGFWLEGDALERLRELALARSVRDNRALNERAKSASKDTKEG